MDVERVPLILSVDCEPDKLMFPLEDPSPATGLEWFAREHERLRDSLEEATGRPAQFSWCLRMDPQIQLTYGTPTWLADRFGPFFESVRALGDSVGIHPHALRWDEAKGVWVSDHADDAWVANCVDVSFDAYRQAFGEPPALHKFGGGFMSTAVMNQIRRLGARFDMTLEPGEHPVAPGRRKGGIWTGWTPDFGPVPRTPFHPDTSDFRRPASNGTDSLWAIPVTSGRFVAAPGPTTSDRLRRPGQTARGALRRLRVLRRRAMPGRPAHSPLAMWRDWRSPEDFWHSVFATIDELEWPYLAFSIRSDTPVRADNKERFDGIIGHLLQDPRARQLEFVTPETALRRLALVA